MAVVLLASVARALMTEPLGGNDETAHLDYAYQVWLGRLPVFEDGVVLTPGFGSSPPVQWVAQHPPLFYVLLAPIVGPLVDGQHMFAAVIAARFANALVAAATVLAVWWAVRQCWPDARRLAAAAAVVTSLTGMIILVGGAVYNDLLASTFSALALGLAARMLRRGISWGTAAAAVLVAVGGMSTRLSLAVFVGVMVVAALLSARRGESTPRAWAMRIGTAFALVVAPVAAIGWFYLRNVRLTGGITGGHPDWAAENLGRVDRSAVEVVSDTRFWSGLFSIFRIDSPADGYAPWLLLLIPIGSAVVAAIVWAVRGRRSPVSRALVLVGVMVVGVTVVVVAMQISYVTTGGAANTRYALPLIALLAAAVAVGLTAWRRLAPVLLSLWAVGAAATYTASFSVPLPITTSPWAEGMKWAAYALSLAALAVCLVGFARLNARRDAEVSTVA